MQVAVASEEGMAKRAGGEAGAGAGAGAGMRRTGMRRRRRRTTRRVAAGSWTMRMGRGREEGKWLGGARGEGGGVSGMMGLEKRGMM